LRNHDFNLQRREGRAHHPAMIVIVHDRSRDGSIRETHALRAEERT